MGRPGPWKLMGVCSCGETVPVRRIFLVGPPGDDEVRVLNSFVHDVCPRCGSMLDESCARKAVREVPISVWWDPRTWGKFTVEVKDPVGVETNDLNKEKSK